MNKTVFLIQIYNSVVFHIGKKKNKKEEYFVHKSTLNVCADSSTAP